MATNEEIFAKAKAAIIDFDDEAAEEVAQEAIDAKLNIVEFLENGFTAAMKEIGEKFETGELFLPHLIAASDAMNAGMSVLLPVIEKGQKGDKVATVVLGTIAGDIHSIGKDIVAAMLKIADGQSPHHVALHGLLKPRKPDTVYQWLDWYAQDGMDGLLARQPGGYRRGAL